MLSSKSKPRVVTTQAYSKIPFMIQKVATELIAFKLKNVK
jgi:hypothetical protein